MSVKIKIGCLITALIGIFALDGCNGNTVHEHTYADKWSYDATYHWREPTCRDTDEPKGKSIHNFYKGECTLCHYPDPNYEPPKTDEDPKQPEKDPNEPIDPDDPTEEQAKPDKEETPSVNNEGKTMKSNGYEITEIFGGDGDIEGYSVAAGDHLGDSTIDIPLAFKGYPVVKIANMGFSGSKASRITIPKTVREFGYMAFEGCRNLTSIELPDILTEMGAECFKDCVSLTHVTIPNEVTQIRYKTFSGCTALETVILSDSVEELHRKAFENCTGMKTVTLGKGIKLILRQAFYNCTALSTIRIADLTSYCSIMTYEYGKTLPAEYAHHIFDMSSNSLVTDLVVPAEVENIARKAFYRIDDLVSVTLSEGVRTAGDDCFSGCKNLKSVKLPSTFENVGMMTFYDCDALTDIYLPSALQTIGYRMFMDCDNLRTVSIGRGVTSISSEIFSRCISLETVTYRGTITQWDAIEKKYDWNYLMPSVNVTFSGS